MRAEYLGILGFAAAAIALTGALLGLGRWLAPRGQRGERAPADAPRDAARGRHAVPFLLVALLFVVFDVQVLFLFPWAVTFREVGVQGLVAIALFAIPMLVGLAYERAKGALDG